LRQVCAVLACNAGDDGGFHGCTGMVLVRHGHNFSMAACTDLAADCQVRMW
jgi:hypothetical protein